jgi:hypothetical protein
MFGSVVAERSAGHDGFSRLKAALGYITPHESVVNGIASHDVPHGFHRCLLRLLVLVPLLSLELLVLADTLKGL